MLWVDGDWNRVEKASLACVLSSSGVEVWSFRFVRWSFRFVRWAFGEFKQWVTLIGLCSGGERAKQACDSFTVQPQVAKIEAILRQVAKTRR
jgi:hypothetical protein